MNENLINTQNNLTKKSRFKKLYDENKIFIFSTILLIFITIVSLSFYFESQENKKALLSDNYVQAKIYIENGEKDKAQNILKKMISENDDIYSVLALYLILDEKLINNQTEISNLFNYILKENKFEKEVKDSIIFKKILFESSFSEELELLESAKPLLMAESSWKPNALLLLGDFFVSKKEYLKAKEFYLQILSLKNLNKEFYDQAKSQLMVIAND